ncbi:type II toxin-antitoxin system HigB family toxin [Candidatus Parcubacteria bacterium]|nr:type II toxin-antitoxin system HigB family toxin [Patescibacteria group bacterium]MCG2691044.1 type II toxin-antitoxin system HigB family toxin [Candidatus Parcubacteria bacterium]
MKIVNRKVLDNFKKKHVETRSQVDAWEAETNAADWNMPSDIKRRYATASFLADNHVVFNLKGNRYRLLVQVSFKNKIVFIKKIGSHNEYMKWEIN